MFPKRGKNKVIGPRRRRWESKQPPYCSKATVATIAGLVLFSIICFRNLSQKVPSKHDNEGWKNQALKISPGILKNKNRTSKVRGHRANSFNIDEFSSQEPILDAIIVGSGLAGLTAALTIIDRGGSVIIIEKEHFLGGNSNKASSGMNACCMKDEVEYNNDTESIFFEDTVKSAGDVVDEELVKTLVSNSAEALGWMRDRVGIDLSILVQLGGHSRKRTHRPKTGFVGAEMISALEYSIEEYPSRARVLLDTRVTEILKDQSGGVIGVTTESRLGEYRSFRSDHVVLATGGFASDRSSGSFLEKYRPELMDMAATAGGFSTGDGITLAESLGAATRDMEKIQIHPTGFVDPSDPTNPNKVLAAELLRGVGGILVNSNGRRFCNELGTRAYVTDKMLSHDEAYATLKTWTRSAPVPTFYLILSEKASADAGKHVEVYKHKGLMTNVNGIDELGALLGISKKALLETFEQYHTDSMIGYDSFGKEVFENVPGMATLQDEVFSVGEVTPVLHYCMGGIVINSLGEVLTNDGYPVPGLYAAGEVTGGVHGNNRLGGNSLLECAVYGSIIGKTIPIRMSEQGMADTEMETKDSDEMTVPAIGRSTKVISAEELSIHRESNDCWVGLHGKVYDLTSFAYHHPGGVNTILSLAGTDATGMFSIAHSEKTVHRIQNLLVGSLKGSDNFTKTQQKVSRSNERKIISLDELALHNTDDDCWVIFYGSVYDLTEFSKLHPGGPYLIQKHAGRDGTSSFEGFHRKNKLAMIKPFLVGGLAT